MHRGRNASDAVAGFAAAGEGHPVGAKGGVIVDAHRRCIQTLSRVQRGRQVFCEDARLKGRRQRIRGADCVLELSEGADGGDRSEDLLGCDTGPSGGWTTIAGSNAVSDRRPPPMILAPPVDASSIHAVTRSASRGRISGPTSVSSISGSPTLRAATRAAKRSTKVRSRSAWTKMRCTETQTWPA